MNEHVAHPTWSDPDAAVAFLLGLRSTGPWNLTAIVPDVAGAEAATFTDPKKARSWIAERSGRANCYYMPNPAPRPSGASGRANKGDVPSAHFVHVDLDLDKLPEDHELHPFPLADRKARVAAQLAAMANPGPPSTVVDTGGGLQALWTLDPPLSDIGLAERLNEHMLASLPGGDPGTHNVDRLLRLPGTVNLPDTKKRARGRSKAPARLLDASDNNYADIEFSAAPARVRADVDIQFDAPVFTDDLAELSLPKRLATIVRDGRLPERKKGDDSRSAWLFDAVCGLLRHGVPDEVVLGLLLDSRWGIADSVLDHGEHDQLRYAEHQVRRAHGAIIAESPDVEEPLAVADGRKAARLRARSLTQLMDLPEPVWLVEGLLPETGTGTMYGPPFAGKTFMALDLGLHIALGKPFHGIPVTQGAVVHVAAEGSPARIRDRVLAWCARHDVEPSALDGRWSLVDVPVRLDDSAHVEAWLKANLDEDGTFRRALVIFDTQARNMVGDENSAKDISKMVAGIDDIRSVTGGFALRLHHEGREAKVGGRGSTAGAGADDVTLHLKVVEKNKRVQLETEALRDGESGQRWLFDMTQQTFVHGGESRASLVLKIVSQGTLDRLLIRIHEEQPRSPADLIGDEEGFSKANLYKLLDKARDKGLIEAGALVLTIVGERRAKELGAIDPAELDFAEEPTE